MPTMFHKPYLNKNYYHFNSDILPPRSASATTCKNPNSFFDDYAGLRTFPLRPYSEAEDLLSTQEDNEFDLAPIIAPLPNKCFYSGFDLLEDKCEEAPAELQTVLSQPIQSDEELIISELLSITRPDGSNNTMDSRAAGIETDNSVTSEYDLWHSRRATQELTDLRSDITPRPFCGPSKKTSSQFNISPLRGSGIGSPYGLVNSVHH